MPDDDGPASSLEQRVLDYVNRPGYEPVKPRALAKRLDIPKKRLDELRETLDRLQTAGQIRVGGSGRIKPRTPAGLIAGVMRKHLVERVAGREDVLGLNLDVRDLPPHLAVRLVDHHLRVGQAEPLPLRAPGKHDRPAARREADAVRRHVAREELHRVVDRHRRGDAPAWAIDVHVHVLVAVLALAVCLLDLVLTLGVIRRLRQHTDLISQLSGELPDASGRLPYTILAERRTVGPFEAVESTELSV